MKKVSNKDLSCLENPLYDRALVFEMGKNIFTFSTS